MKTAMLGLLVTFGAVGGLDLAADLTQLVQCTAIGVVGLSMMAIGVSMETNQ